MFTEEELKISQFDAADYLNIVKILSGLNDIERSDFSDAEEFLEGLSRENV